VTEGVHFELPVSEVRDDTDIFLCGSATERAREVLQEYMGDLGYDSLQGVGVLLVPGGEVLWQRFRQGMGSTFACAIPTSAPWLLATSSPTASRGGPALAEWASFGGPGLVVAPLDTVGDLFEFFFPESSSLSPKEGEIAHLQFIRLEERWRWVRTIR
jgi:hypothetical protein